MYYPEEVVDQVIAANDIVDVIGSYVHLKKSGSSYVGLCPFHSEKTPSFSVSPSKGVFHCFGCGEGGNVITFLMKYENDTFQEALKALADRAGIKLPEVNYSEEAKKQQQAKLTLLAINKDAATYYYRLLRSPKGRTGLSYFQKRGLTPEIMNRFGLGFADGADSDLVAFLRKKGYRDEDILTSGVAVFDEKRGLHDKFWNRVMYPIMDVTNRVIGFGGRVMGDGKPKYLNSPETPVFDKSRNLYGLNLAKRTRTGYFILCEGYMDVIAMHQAGFPMAVASLGTAFTEQQAQILRRYTKRILLDYDSDGAGVKAALRNMEILRAAGLPCRVVNMRPAKDADEFMKTLGPEEFQKRLDDAENSFLYRIRQMQTQYRMDDPASRTAFYREIAKALCGFSNEIERENYIKAVAEQYFIPVDALRREVASYDAAGGQQVQAPRMRPPVRGESPADGKKLSAAQEAARRNERLLLTWLSDDPGLYRQVRPFISPEDFGEGVYREAARRYFAILEKQLPDPLAASASGTGDAGPAAKSAAGTGPASVIAAFETPEEQQEAAELFETRIGGITDRSQKEKALQDIVFSIKDNALTQAAQNPQASGTADGGAGELKRIVEGKKLLAKIRSTQFTVRDDA